MTFKVRQKLLLWFLLAMLLTALLLPVAAGFTGASLSPAVSARSVNAGSGAVSVIACAADPGGGQGSGGGC